MPDGKWFFQNRIRYVTVWPIIDPRVVKRQYSQYKTLQLHPIQGILINGLFSHYPKHADTILPTDPKYAPVRIASSLSSWTDPF